MSKSLKLRVLLNERLESAAEEIFHIFETVIAEYEDELRARAKKDKQEQSQAPEGESEASRRSDTHFLSFCQKESSPETFENPALTCFKEEPATGIKQEEEPLPFTVVEESAEHQRAAHQRAAHQRAAHQRAAHQRAAHQRAAHQPSADEMTNTNSNISEQSDFHSSEQTRTPSKGSGAGVRTERRRSNERFAAKPKGPKLHQCAQCGKEYHHSSSLFRHLLTHREQKPFRCSVCQRGFYQKPHLTVHMRIHTGERPYSCPFCVRTFSIKSNLSQHLRVHTGARPSPCPICGVQFSCLKTLTTHIRRHAHVHLSADQSAAPDPGSGPVWIPTAERNLPAVHSARGASLSNNV